MTETEVTPQIKKMRSEVDALADEALLTIQQRGDELPEETLIAETLALLLMAASRVLIRHLIKQGFGVAQGGVCLMQGRSVSAYQVALVDHVDREMGR